MRDRLAGTKDDPLAVRALRAGGARRATRRLWRTRSPSSNKQPQHSREGEVGEGKQHSPMLSWRRRRPPARWNPSFETPYPPWLLWPGTLLEVKPRTPSTLRFASRFARLPLRVGGATADRTEVSEDVTALAEARLIGCRPTLGLCGSASTRAHPGCQRCARRVEVERAACHERARHEHAKAMRWRGRSYREHDNQRCRFSRGAFDRLSVGRLLLDA
jgi:hypothetical protein